MRKAILALGTFLCVCGITRAASEPNSPYVNEKTVLFGRVQTDRIDMGQIEQFILDSVGGAATSRPADFSLFQSSLHDQLGEATRWLKEFKEAGGHEIDMIGQSDFMPNDGAAVIMPLAPGSNAQQIAALIKTGHKEGPLPATRPGWETQPEIVPNRAVLFASARVRAEFKALVPAPAPAIAAAISASGDAPMVIIFAPDAVMRAHLLQVLPSMILAQPTRTIVNGVDWMEEFATAPPNPDMHLIIQTKDATTAMQVSGLINLALAMMLTDSDLGTLQNRTALVKLLTPGVKGDRVQVDLDSARLAELARALKPAYMSAMQQALRVKTMSNMRQILQAILLYRNAHKNEWPVNLTTAVQPFPDQQSVLSTNPRNPQQKPAYVYIKPKTPIANESELMVLYEAHDQFGDGVNVGFADGHVEFISNSQRFKDLLLQSYQESMPDQ